MGKNRGKIMKQEFYVGRVKQYNADKGFGFISTTEGDIFFHISDFPASEGEPKRNEKVAEIVEKWCQELQIEAKTAKIDEKVVYSPGKFR